MFLRKEKTRKKLKKKEKRLNLFLRKRTALSVGFIKDEKIKELNKRSVF